MGRGPGHWALWIVKGCGEQQLVSGRPGLESQLGQFFFLTSLSLSFLLCKVEGKLMVLIVGLNQLLQEELLQCMYMISTQCALLVSIFFLVLCFFIVYFSSVQSLLLRASFF